MSAPRHASSTSTIAIPPASLRRVLEQLGYTAVATDFDSWVMMRPGGASVSIPRLGATVGRHALQSTLARVCLTLEGLLDVWQQLATPLPTPAVLGPSPRVHGAGGER